MVAPVPLSNLIVVSCFLLFLLPVVLSLSSSRATSNPSTNKIEAKFEKMINKLKIPAATVEFIDSPKQRVLFRGVSAAAAEPLVEKAFKIVYKDLGPVRVAGDLIFAQLSPVALEASERAAGMIITSQLERGDAATGEVEGMVDATKSLATSRQLFDLIDSDKSGGLSKDELMASTELMAVIRGVDEAGDNDNSSDNDVADRFINLADENGDGVISFVEFANAAAVNPRLQLVDEAFEAVIQSIVSSSGENEKKKRRGMFGRKSPEDRFNTMLQECLVWENELGCGPDADATQKDDECVVGDNMEPKEDEDGRLLQVLKGSLVGARCDPVVDALKMCYLEYSPLRLGGDIIFKLLKRIVAKEISKMQ